MATRIEELLRTLALEDQRTIETTLAVHVGWTHAGWLEEKHQSLVRLGALIALDASTVSYVAVVADALAAGASDGEVFGVLVSVAPLVGVARVTAAVPALADALGYDLDAAFERMDDEGSGHRTPVHDERT